MLYKNVTLEISSKPFRSNSEDAMEEVLCRMFRQWQALSEHAEVISVLLWLADGSEILEYRGNPDDSFEWAKWLGTANPRGKRLPDDDPDARSMHHTPSLYMDNPPTHTYGWIQTLVRTIKRVGTKITHKPIRVGATFDPGPEFAKSRFKYEKHPELCIGSTMADGSFMCCYTTLKQDNNVYAGFPDGVAEGTTIGTFLGRQSRHFMTDMGIDYLWLSNGFGFGLETWGMYGAVFDGKTFSADRCEDVKNKNLLFWNSFCEECSFPVETRGTNLSTGIDLASDAVPLRDIYQGGYNMEPPPNSPWAALDSDFGLEMIGWMSHIAEIPGETYPFRFYTHDPWWLNSPWLDRYCREAHDIFLPMAVARMTARGEVRTPTSVEILTVDDSYGRMPEEVPNEVIPHVLACARTAPDHAGPLVWAYPFDEYHDMTCAGKRISEVFFGDWFMRTAFNQGLPLNTVISTRALTQALMDNPDAFSESILVTPVPDANTVVSRALLHFVRQGGRLLLYGTMVHADKNLLAAVGLELAESLEGEFDLRLFLEDDISPGNPPAMRIRHQALSSGGGLCEIAASEHAPQILAAATQAGLTRVVAAARSATEWNNGQVVWVRGTNSFQLPENRNARKPEMLPETKFFRTERIMRLALQSFGLTMLVEKPGPVCEGVTSACPLLTISRHQNAYWFAGYCPDTMVTLKLCLPQGAPLLLNETTRLIDGRAHYSPPMAWRRECRVFVEQKAPASISCKEQHSGHPDISRRIWVKGLVGANVRFYHEPDSGTKVQMLCNPVAPFLKGDFLKFRVATDNTGQHLVAENVCGELLISW